MWLLYKPLKYLTAFKSFNKLSSIVTSQSWRTLQKSTMSSKRLAAFDFDSTIIVDNSDTVVRDQLLPKDAIIKFNIHDANSWTAYMQDIFEQLHSNKIDEATIEKTVTQIPAIDGMCELIEHLSQNLNFDIIIISDANSYFITKWVENQKLTKCIKQIFSNPGKFIDGLLNIEMYHVQDWCTLSTRNLCKGQILDDFVEFQKKAGVSYNQVVYVGDGLNDFCPILRLSSSDLACCREGFKCADIVRNVLEGKPFRDKIYEVKSDVMIWSTGFDILNAIKKS